MKLNAYLLKAAKDFSKIFLTVLIAAIYTIANVENPTNASFWASVTALIVGVLWMVIPFNKGLLKTIFFALISVGLGLQVLSSLSTLLLFEMYGDQNATNPVVAGLLEFAIFSPWYVHVFLMLSYIAFIALVYSFEKHVEKTKINPATL